VWQELIDKDILRIARDAYESIVQLGGDPNRPEYAGVNPIDALKSEAQTALNANRLSPAPIARDRGQSGLMFKEVSPLGSPGAVPGENGAARRQQSRFPVKGFQISGTFSIDPALRLPALLTELETKLREKYAFTIFAANEQERSVNFGILNTYRQTWTPLG